MLFKLPPINFGLLLPIAFAFSATLLGSCMSGLTAWYWIPVPLIVWLAIVAVCAFFLGWKDGEK